MEYADVANAAATLEKDGIKPTVLLVRAKLGKGSLRDITPLLKRWKAERRGETTATAAALPEHIAQTIAGIIAQERAAAIATIQAELNETAKERDELAEALASREDDANNATVTINIKQERIAEMQGEIAALREQITQLQAQAEQYAANLTTERARAAELEQRLASQQAQIVTAEETHRDNDTLRAEHVRLVSEAATAKAALDAAQARADAAEARATGAEQRAREAAQEAAQARTEAAAATATAAAATQTATAAETRAQAAQEDARRLLAALTAAQAPAEEPKPTPKKGKAKKTTKQDDEVESLDMFGKA